MHIHIYIYIYMYILEELYVSEHCSLQTANTSLPGRIDVFGRCTRAIDLCLVKNIIINTHHIFRSACLSNYNNIRNTVWAAYRLNPRPNTHTHTHTLHCTALRVFTCHAASHNRIPIVVVFVFFFFSRPMTKRLGVYDIKIIYLFNIHYRRRRS
jgi:hypothetical protein